jgi:hypothetical protein
MEVTRRDLEDERDDWLYAVVMVVMVVDRVDEERERSVTIEGCA